MPENNLPMNFIKQTTLIFAFASLILSSCTKEDDHAAPEITFNEPSLNLYGIADTVPVKVHIHDDEELEAVTIQITNDENDEVISMKWNHVHNAHLMIDTFFVAYLDTALSVDDMCNYYILVEAKDASGNFEKENKSVHIMEGSMDDHHSHSDMNSDTDSGMDDHMDGHMNHSGM